MFVFKAGVVGAGVMGGEIAQVIAATGIPVVLKDVDQKFVDAGLTKAREVTEGEDTSPETAQAAANFAQAIKKMPVRCHECPGFVVNRILVSTASEIWRYQDESGIPVEELDAFITEKAQMPMGPFRVADMSGLDTVVKVARDMQEAYGDRFYVHKGMEEMVERGELGAKSGKGFYEHA